MVFVIPGTRWFASYLPVESDITASIMKHNGKSVSNQCVWFKVCTFLPKHDLISSFSICEKSEIPKKVELENDRQVFESMSFKVPRNSYNVFRERHSNWIVRSTTIFKINYCIFWQHYGALQSIHAWFMKYFVFFRSHWMRYFISAITDFSMSYCKFSSSSGCPYSLFHLLAPNVSWFTQRVNKNALSQ